MKDMQDLSALLKYFAEAADIASRYITDACYHDALAVYGFLEQYERDRIPGARELVCQLQPFFHHEKT
jgi:hypothetical protein